MTRTAGLVRKSEIGTHIDATAGTQFSREQPHHRQPGPLSKAKWLQKLPLSVLKGERNRIDCRNRQNTPQLRAQKQGTGNNAIGSNQFAGIQEKEILV
jgi:hypothetical protein